MRLRQVSCPLNPSNLEYDLGQLRRPGFLYQPKLGKLARIKPHQAENFVTGYSQRSAMMRSTRIALRAGM